MVAATVIWGFAFVIVKNSVDLVPPLYMMAFRFTIGFAGMAVLFAGRWRYLSKNSFKAGVIIGIFLFLSYFFQTVGIQYTTAGKNAFLTTVYVVIVPFFSWALYKKRPDRSCFCAALMAITGIGLLSLQGDLSVNIGDVLTLICGFGYAAHIMSVDKYTETCDPILLTMIQMLVAALLSWGFAPIVSGGFPAGLWQPDVLTGMLYLGLGSSMLGFLLQNLGQKYTNPSLASVLLSLESVFGALFSVWFLGERMTGRMWIGCVLIFGAVLTAEVKRPVLKKDATGG
ncbi:MAG: EamA family transporter [Lachnospiraceae bacterium]|nr:EamA family transporter [Lachnospiraceae bacterium]